MREHVPAAMRRGRHMRKTAIVLNVLATAQVLAVTAEACRTERREN
jgi:hypothetical protein